jgi:hypothetical protein
MARSIQGIDIKKFGRDAKRETITPPAPSLCQHHFSMATSREAICEKCQMGFYIGVGDTIEDGHLYRRGKKII